MILDHKQIAEITLRFPAPGASIIDNNELKSHNAQYILPILAVFGEVNIEDILFERRTDPEVNRLSKNTHLIYDAELGPEFPEKYTSVIVVKTKDGRSFEERVEYAKGTPQNPVRFGDIEDKFRKLTARELSPAKIEKCITTVKEFDKLQTITPLINLIKG